MSPFNRVTGKDNAGEWRAGSFFTEQRKHRHPDIELGLLFQIALGGVDGVGREGVLLLRDLTVARFMRCTQADFGNYI